MSRSTGHLDSPPPSVDVHVEFGARSRQGPLRSLNEDHYLIVRLGRHQETLMTSLPDAERPKRFDESAYGMLIADGMGHAGDIASRLAITTFAHLAVYFGKWNVRIDESIAGEVMDRGEQFFRAVDSTLVRASHQASVRLGTTLTAVYTTGSELFFAHVGHSRAYLFRNGELSQLTRDHTLGAERLTRSLSVNIVPRAPDLHDTLTKMIGGAGAGGPNIDVERCGLLDGDAILLCTNGLTSVVEDTRIGNAMRLNRTPDDQCRALVNLTIDADGRDDVTVLVAKYRIPR